MKPNKIIWPLLTVFLFNFALAADLNLLTKVNMPAHASLDYAALNPDGSTFVLGVKGGLNVYSTQGKLVGRYQDKNGFYPRRLMYSRTGECIFAFGEPQDGGTVVFLNPKNGKLLHRYDQIKGVDAFSSASCKTYVVAGWNEAYKGRISWRETSSNAEFDAFGHPTISIRYVIKVPKNNDTLAMTENELVYIKDGPPLEVTARVTFGEYSTRRMVVSPTGKHLAVISRGDMVDIYSLPDLSRVNAVQTSGGAWASVFSPDGKYFLVADQQVLKVVDLKSQQVTRSMKFNDYITAVGVSASGKRLLVGTLKTAYLYEGKKGSTVFR